MELLNEFNPALLDDYNRVNEGPPPSLNYSTPDGFSGRQVIDNTCAATVIDNAFTWNTVYAADQENAVTLIVPPLNGQGIRLVVRQFEASLFRDCYYAEWVSNDPAAGTLRFWKRVLITDTQLGADITLPAPLGTQQIGVRVVGTTITAWFNGVQVGSRIDSGVTGSGRLMVNCTDANCRFDNFRGGAV